MDLLSNSTKELALTVGVNAGLNYVESKKLDLNEQAAVAVSCVAANVVVERFDVPLHIPYTTKQQSMAPLIYTAVKVASGERNWKKLAMDNAKLVASMKVAEYGLKTLTPDNEHQINRQRLPF